MNFIEAQEYLTRYKNGFICNPSILHEAIEVVINYKVEIPQNEIEDELKQYSSNTFKVDFNLGVRWAIQKLSDKLCQKQYKKYAEEASV